MSPLSVLLDEEMIAKVEEGARLSNVSVSNFVANALNAYMSDQRRAWQEDVRALFGSITDETFQRQPELPFSLDAKREEF